MLAHQNLDNSTSGQGGGIANSGSLTVTNSTFSGNSAYFGGGIANTSPSGGGLIYLKNTILTASYFMHRRVSNCWLIRQRGDRGYNISDDYSCRFSAAGSENNTDPMLDPNGLRRNGGPTRTIALLAGSPAIAAIPLADCTKPFWPYNPIITDQRGFPRPDGGETDCDIGAYEHQDIPSTPFRWFAGLLTITSDTGHFELATRFKLGASGTIDPATQPVTFGISSYAVRLPAGSFVSDGTGYLYHGPINGRFLRLFIKPTDMPGIYALIACGGTGRILRYASNPVPVTLTIGDNFGSTQINATVN